MWGYKERRGGEGEFTSGHDDAPARTSAEPGPGRPHQARPTAYLGGGGQDGKIPRASGTADRTMQGAPSTLHFMYLIHVLQADWTAMSTLSARPAAAPGSPFVNILSTSDGPAGQSSGTPYFYTSPLEMSGELGLLDF